MYVCIDSSFLIINTTIYNDLGEISLAFKSALFNYVDKFIFLSLFINVIEFLVFFLFDKFAEFIHYMIRSIFQKLNASSYELNSF